MMSDYASSSWAVLSRRHLLLFAIGVIVLACAFAQSWLLHHELVDCLPYKIMTISDRSRVVAQIAFRCGPLVAVGVVASNALLKERSLRTWLISLGATVACPLVFIITYRLLTPTPTPNLQAPDFGIDAAWSQFLRAIGFSSVAGLICSGVSIGLVKRAFKRFWSRSA